MTSYIEADIHDVDSIQMARFIYEAKTNTTYFIFVDGKSKEHRMVLGGNDIDTMRKFIHEIDKTPHMGLVKSILLA